MSFPSDLLNFGFDTMKSNNLEQSLTKVTIESRQIVLTIAGEATCHIAIDDLKLVGEYTTADGPFVDDWFIVFITSEKVWNQISEYTPGMSAVLQELGTYLEANMVGWLASSTSWKTNIIWPIQVEGQEMWDVISDKPVTMMARLKQLFGMQSQRLVLTNAAASVFPSTSAKA